MDIRSVFVFLVPSCSITIKLPVEQGDFPPWKLNSASFICVAGTTVASSAAFELPRTWKAKYLHTDSCLFNVKGTRPQKSK